MREGAGTVTLEHPSVSHFSDGNLPLFMDPFADAKRIRIALPGHLSSSGILIVLVQKINGHE